MVEFGLFTFYCESFFIDFYCHDNIPPVYSLGTDILARLFYFIVTDFAINFNSFFKKKWIFGVFFSNK